ncbi:MAG: dephospho-CoA kinase [Propionibacteriaceae bacterium]|jgi:dephospho-CoA kinase|nr:dephospho-CoA kinase [Propionibacteriaceae bacterium]
MRIAVTGGIGSGKSVVAERLKELGAVVIDYDDLARQAVAPGTPGLAAVIAEFGAGVQAPDGSLDRKALGEIIFNDPDARRRLNAIVHPFVFLLAQHAELQAMGQYKLVVHEIPLLVESGLADRFDEVIVVDAEPEQQLARVIARDGLSVAQARARLSAQATRAQRLQAATRVIHNYGTLADLADQVDDLVPQLSS